MKTYKKTSNRKGSILAIAVTIMVLLAILGVGMLMLGRTARVTAARRTADMSARLASDAGFTKALFEMNDLLVTNRGSLWNAVPSPVSFSGNLDNSYGSYSCTASKVGTFSQGIAIDSTGVSGDLGQRSVHVRLLPRSAWYGIGVKDSINIKSGTEFFTINPSGGEVILQTTSTGDGKIILKPGVTIPGDIIVGPGGNVDEVIDYGPRSDVEGDAYASIEEIQFPSVVIPDYFAPLISEAVNSTQDLNGSLDRDNPIKKKFSEISLGTGDVVSVQGHLEVLVTDKMEIDNSGEIRFGADSSLVLYVDCEQIILRNGSDGGFTQDANVAASAENLKIFATANCTYMELKASTDFYAAIYAPDTVIEQKAKGDIYGAIIAYSMELYAGSNFYLDLALADVDQNYEGVYFAVSRWWED